MTRSTGTRLYRACIRCRQRKTKCDLKYANENGHQPCSKCSTEGFNCITAGSNRGGDYSHFRRRQKCQSRRQVVRDSDRLENQRHSSGVPISKALDDTQGHNISGGIQNPLEALQILAQTASGERTTERKTSNLRQSTNHLSLSDGICSHLGGDNPSLRETEMIREGIIDMQSIEPLLKYYANNYHCYLPIVPRHLLYEGNCEHQWADETFLLATVLTIATKDRQGLESLHARILGYMERLLLRVALGSRSVRHVGSVEGLLLLAEWVAHINTEASSGGDIRRLAQPEQGETSEEDSLAWCLIGLAVRQAYLLHLERNSFRGQVRSESEGVSNRKRLAWIFTYLADRQISIQMGQAFWCRGPGLSTQFTAHDYPSLRPEKAGQVDYASFIQAQVELTTIFGNVHDILYASKSRTVQLILMGDYTKYLDDSAKALDMWKRTWSNLDVPTHLSGLLTLQFEYLRLYMIAFAFQALLYRSSRENASSDTERTVSYFPYSVMASPDGRHIYIAIDAAKSVLRELMNQFNPSKHLRFLPVRYLLYEIHASVFLFKAHTVGALSPGEYHTCFALTRQFISMLRDAATTPGHIASKYAKLLAGLWFQGQSTDATNQTLQMPDPGQGLTDNVRSPLPVAPRELRDVPEVIQFEDERTQFPMMDMSSGAEGIPFMDTGDILDCPDAFLCNLPFLRAGIPNLDDDINQLLVAKF